MNPHIARHGQNTLATEAWRKILGFFFVAALLLWAVPRECKTELWFAIPILPFVLGWFIGWWNGLTERSESHQLALPDHKQLQGSRHEVCTAEKEASGYSPVFRETARTILVIDDNPDILRIVSQVLKTDGHQVMCANEGRTALDILKNHSPDVILLDLMMPYMDGLAVLKTVKDQPSTANIPVIIFTEKRDETLAAAFQLGAQYMIPKPWVGDELIKSVRLILSLNGLTRSEPS